MTKVTIPDFCLVVLMGASGSGKSTFAAQAFFADGSDLLRPLPRDRIR